MITTVGATDFRYLSQQELDEIGFSNGVFWNSEEFNILGGTLSTEATEGSIRETDAADIGFMNSLCEGDFASKSQTVSVSEVEQRELTGYCVNGEESTQYVAVKTKLKNSVLYNIMIFGPRAKLESAERQRATGNVAIQAAQFFESE